MDHPLPFLLSVVVISLSGIMFPGPVLVATVSQGYKDRKAGLTISLGHGLVEIPLIIALYFGLRAVLSHPSVVTGIGLVGGLALILLGYQGLKFGEGAGEEATPSPHSSLWAGVVATAGNPYFFLWWTTVGSALLSRAIGFPHWVLWLFPIVHWLCDLGWNLGVSLMSFKSGKLWGLRGYRKVSFGCGLAMIGFGVWFMGSSLLVR